MRKMYKKYTIFNEPFTLYKLLSSKINTLTLYNDNTGSIFGDITGVPKKMIHKFRVFFQGIEKG